MPKWFVSTYVAAALTAGAGVLWALDQILAAPPEWLPWAVLLLFGAALLVWLWKLGVLIAGAASRSVRYSRMIHAAIKEGREVLRRLAEAGDNDTPEHLTAANQWESRVYDALLIYGKKHADAFRHHEGSGNFRAWPHTTILVALEDRLNRLKALLRVGPPDH
jgi:hypothetical protein